VTNSKHITTSLLYEGNETIPKGFQLEGQFGRERLQCKTSYKRTQIITQFISALTHITATFTDSFYSARNARIAMLALQALY